MKPDKSQDTRWTWLQMTRGPKLNVQIFRESTRKQRSFDSKDSSLTAKETKSKAHRQVHTIKELGEKQPGRKPGPNSAKTSRGRLAQADRPSPFRALFGAPFDLAALRTIYRAPAKSHREIHSSSATKEHRREGHHFREERVEMVD
jgi:hypothetical protein